MTPHSTRVIHYGVIAKTLHQKPVCPINGGNVVCPFKCFRSGDYACMAESKSLDEALATAERIDAYICTWEE